MAKQREAKCQETVEREIAQSRDWNGGRKVRDQFLGCGKGKRSLLITKRSLIELSQVDGNAPERWSQPLCMSSILRGSQHLLCFCFPMKRNVRLTSQFPEARDDALLRAVRGGCEQLIGDVQGKKWIVAGKCEFCTRVPDEPLPDRLGGIIRPERGREEGFGPRDIVLCKRDESKEPGYNAGPYP